MSTEATPDPDLPGDEEFKAVGSGADAVELPDGRAVMRMMIAQAAQHHNSLRYAELQKARLGQANRYRESRYR